MREQRNVWCSTAKVWVRSEAATLGVAAGFEGKTASWGEVAVAGSDGAAADGCGFCGDGPAATTVVPAWASFVLWTRLHAVKDTAAANTATTATLRRRTFMAKRIPRLRSHVKEQRGVNFRTITDWDKLTRFLKYADKLNNNLAENTMRLLAIG